MTTGAIAGKTTVLHVYRPATAPASTPLQAIGFQLADHGRPGAVYVDTVAW